MFSDCLNSVLFIRTNVLRFFRSHAHKYYPLHFRYKHSFEHPPNDLLSFGKWLLEISDRWHAFVEHRLHKCCGGLCADTLFQSQGRNIENDDPLEKDDDHFVKLISSCKWLNRKMITHTFVLVAMILGRFFLSKFDDLHLNIEINCGGRNLNRFAKIRHK